MKLNSLPQNPHIITKIQEDMRAALYILIKIISIIWAVISVPIYVLLTLVLAFIIYISFYIGAVAVVFWIITF